MQLVADRFVVHEDGRAVDMATAMRVVLVTAPAGAIVAWTACCDALFRIRHHALAPLLDYGPLGRSDRFEAWQCGPAWNGADAPAAWARDTTAEFLRLEGFDAAPTAVALHARHGVPVGLPSLAAVHPRAESAEPGAEMPLQRRGMRTIERPALAAVAEMFDDVAPRRPSAVAVWGAPGSGKTAIVIELARLARLRGLVPVASALVESPYRDLWRGRSLLIIDDNSGGAWPAAVDAAVDTAMAHGILIVGDSEVRGVDGVPIGSVPADVLIDAVRPRPMTRDLERRVRCAAERARGLPGRFARTLWPSIDEPARRSGGRALARVAEQAAAYGGSERRTGVPAAPARGGWPSPGELGELRRRVAESVRSLASGRHARAVRGLRHAIAAFARRDSWTDAAEAGIALAGALRDRGQVRQGQAVLADARQHAARSGVTALVSEVAILAGETWIDAGRPDEAEAVLTTVGTAAGAIDDRDRLTRASLALARCLFWRGRYDEAGAAQDRVADGLVGRLAARRQRLAACIAAARGDHATALRLANDAIDALTPETPAAVRAAVQSTAALVHLAAGDAPVAASYAVAAIREARRGHDPLCAIRARIVGAEAERRRGRSAFAIARLLHLKRLAASLPPLVGAQLELGTMLAAGGDGGIDDALEFARRSGLPPLTLLVPAQRRPSTHPLVDELIAIVRACQTADDEMVVLRDVSSRVRTRLHAAAVGFVGVQAGRLDVLTADGARVDLDVARRAIDATIAIDPHRHDDRIVASAPVHYGGTSIGALAARWTLGSTYDLSCASAVLTAAAAAAAPLVWAAMARRERVGIAACGDLIGETPVMQQIRLQIERAAPAPFPILIEGESGSGKELVARAIHRVGPRRDRVFRTLNCAAIPDELVEAELFGHVRGAFTGAIGDRTGVFEEAHGGTVLLDEVGELTARAQAKLLRVIQEGEVRRVGENLSRHVDVRVVAATNRDLRREAEAGRFRTDLLYRLDVIRIAVPPLRERADDVPLLVEQCWREATSRVGSRATLAAATVGALGRYAWPGNVRELQNVLAALAVRCPKRGVVPPAALPPQFASAVVAPSWTLEEARRTFEARFVRAALVRSGGHRGRAAAELGVTRQGLTKLMSRLDIA